MTKIKTNAEINMITLKNIDKKVLEQYKGLKCLNFECEKDLTPYIDSMLFDSDTTIAFGEFQIEGKEEIFNIELVVNGEVDVDYKGYNYKSPYDFPEELIDKIKTDPYWFCYAPSGETEDNEDGDIYVDMNNWFEYLYGYKENNTNIYIDGMVYEADLSKDTPQGIFNEMVEIAYSDLTD